jgi:hypothetical protein
MFGITAFSQAPFSSLGQNVFNVNVSGAITVSDTTTAIGAFLASMSEQVNVSDASERFLFIVVFNNESLLAIDALTSQTLYDGQVDEDVHADSVNQGVLTTNAATVEQASVSSVDASQVELGAATTEAIVVDAAALSQKITTSFIEVGLNFSSVNLGSLSLFNSVAENISAYDLSISGTATSSVIEEQIEMLSQVDCVRSILATIVEEVANDNAQTLLVDFAGNINETIDVLFLVNSQGILKVDIDENIQFNALDTAGKSISGQQAESLLANSEVVPRIPTVVDVSETIEGGASVAGTADIVVFIVDSVSGNNAQSVLGVFLATQGEVIRSSDVLQVFTDYLVSIDEHSAFHESLLARMLWVPVLNAQVPNWENIGSSTSPEWENIASSTSPGWERA